MSPTWTYAVLLVLLCAIAATAGAFILDELRGMLSHPDDYSLVAGVFWLLTLGFMLITGAFGLWTIRMAGRITARRSVAEVLQSLDFLDDGLFTLERLSDVTGWNAALERYARLPEGGRGRLETMFPLLTAEQHAAIARSTTEDGTREIEVDYCSTDGEDRILRFRSIGAGQVRLVQISDVTQMERDRRRRRQSARLSLFADVARGLRNDLSEILFIIAGHAALLQRLEPGSDEASASVESIVRATERGEALADGFSALVMDQPHEYRPCSAPDVHIRTAGDELEAMLPIDWRVRVDRKEGEAFPPSALSPTQVEQIVINLGLCMAERTQAPATIAITMEAVDEGRRTRFLMGLDRDASAARNAVYTSSEIATEGLIPSVVNDLLESAGGTLDCLRDEAGQAAFRVSLPLASRWPLPNPSDRRGTDGPLAHRTVLYVAPESEDGARHIEGLRRQGCLVVALTSLAPMLARIESSESFDGLVLREDVLRSESSGVLTAIRRLRPSIPLVFLSRQPSETVGMPDGVAVVAPEAEAHRLVQLLDELARAQG